MDVEGILKKMEEIIGEKPRPQVLCENMPGMA